MSETTDAFGVGFRPQHYSWVIAHRPEEIDVFEIVSENFMGVGGRPKYFLEKLRESYPILMHGVSLSIGSKSPLDPNYLKQLKELADFVQPQMISDHLSWGQLGQQNSHDLLPIAYTHESMNDLVGKIAYLQDFLGRRFYFENPSAYVAFRSADYDEAGFFAELLKRTGAGILLDLNNLYVNHKNLNQDPEAFMRALRKEDLGYFHLAGHSDQGDVLVDTHDHPVPDAVWNLYSKACEYFPSKAAIIEWDGNVPEFPRLLEESRKARFYAKNASIALPLGNSSAIALEVSKAKAQGNIYKYSKFFEQIVRPFGIDENATNFLRADLPVQVKTGLKVYNHAYFLRLEELLVDTFPALFFVCEEEGFRYLVAAYLESHPPMGPSLKGVGTKLSSFLRDPESESKLDYDFGVPLAILGDIAALEWARAEVFVAKDSVKLLKPEQLKTFSPKLWESAIFRSSDALRHVRCEYETLAVLHALDREETPLPPELGKSSYLVNREGFAVFESELSEDEACLLEALSCGVTVMEACAVIGKTLPGRYDSDRISFVASKLIDWASKGLIELRECKSLSANKAALSELGLS